MTPEKQLIIAMKASLEYMLYTFVDKNGSWHNQVEAAEEARLLIKKASDLLNN